MPIQNVSAAPAVEPAVAMSGTIQASRPMRAERMITAASMPNGSEKNSVESSAASTKTPIGDAQRATTQRLNGCIFVRAAEARPGPADVHCSCRALDRYAASNVNFVPIAQDPHSG